MIKSTSLHLSNPAEWWWILFGDGLRVLKKVKKWVQACMCVWQHESTCMYVCVGGQTYPACSSSWLGSCVRDTCAPHALNTQAFKVHWKSALMLGLMAKSLMPLVPRHSIDNGPGQEPLSGHFQKWEPLVRKSIDRGTAHYSKPPLHNHHVCWTLAGPFSP